MTSCMSRVNIWLLTVPEQRYVPSSSGQTSVKVADLSAEDCEEEGRRRRRGAALYKDPNSFFSQMVSPGLKAAENTQGRVTVAPIEAYTLVPSARGLIIPEQPKENIGDNVLGWGEKRSKLNFQLMSREPTHLRQQELLKLSTPHPGD